VGTGLEEKVARDSGAVIAAKRGGVVTRVTADEIIIDSGEGQSPIGTQPLARLAHGPLHRGPGQGSETRAFREALLPPATCGRVAESVRS